MCYSNVHKDKFNPNMAYNKRYEVKESKSGISAVMLQRGGSAGPYFMIQYKDPTIEMGNIPLTLHEVESFIEDNPDLVEINEILMEEAKKITISYEGSGIFTSYEQHKQRLKESEQQKTELEYKVSYFNTQGCIKRPNDMDAVTIYTSIPMQYYKNVLDGGLKSYAQLGQRTRGNVLVGHDQCVYFRPNAWVSDTALETEPIVGIKVDPKQVKIANQEIRTLSDTPSNLAKMYLASEVGYDQFLLEITSAKQAMPPKAPFSNSAGHLVWLTYEEGARYGYTDYIPEIAINISTHITPEMFSYVNAQLARPLDSGPMQEISSTSKQAIHPEMHEEDLLDPRQAVNNKFHLFEVKGEKFTALKEEYKKLRGDHLKTNILLELKRQIGFTSSKEELAALVSKLKESEEYKVLETNQDLTGKIFDFETSSVKAFKEMVKKQENSFEQPVQPKK